MTTKDKVLQLLMEEEGEPVSGQQMADTLGLSRTAVWKWIKELETEGYQIESIRKKGYVLHDFPDRIEKAHVAPLLETNRYGTVIETYETCESTQLIAHQRAQEGAPDGTIIIADEQTAGKGRLARPWESTKGSGIWMSVILRPDLTFQEAPQVTLVTAVAIVQALKEVTGVEAQIKWPNDILLGDLKLTGILTELQAEPDRIQAIIVGIGMNVNQKATDFPEELREIATSLRMQTDKKWDRAPIIAAILKYMEKYIAIYEKEGFGPIRLLWESYSITTGKRIRATLVDEVLEGEALGISDEGLLKVRLDDGTIRSIYSADISRMP